MSTDQPGIRQHAATIDDATGVALAMLRSPALYVWSAIAGGAIVLLLLAFFAAPLIPIFSAIWDVTVLMAGLAVLAASPPLPRLRDRSALLARLSWFGGYLLAAVVLLASVLLGQSLATSSLQEAMDAAPLMLVQLLMPLGLVILAILILLDLARLGTAARVGVLGAWLEKNAPKIPVSAQAVFAALGAGLGHPALVSIGMIALVVSWQLAPFGASS